MLFTKVWIGIGWWSGKFLHVQLLVNGMITFLVIWTDKVPLLIPVYTPYWRLRQYTDSSCYAMHCNTLFSPALVVSQNQKCTSTNMEGPVRKRVLHAKDLSSNHCIVLLPYRDRSPVYQCDRNCGLLWKVLHHSQCEKHTILLHINQRVLFQAHNLPVTYLP